MSSLWQEKTAVASETPFETSGQNDGQATLFRNGCPWSSLLLGAVKMCGGCPEFIKRKSSSQIEKEHFNPQDWCRN